MANQSEIGVDRGGGAPRTPYETGINPFPSSAAPTSRIHPSATRPGADDASRSAGPDFGETARTATDALKQHAVQLAQEVGRGFGEGQKARSADALSRFARAIDNAANDLQDQSPIVARTVHEAARQVDGLSKKLADHDVNELMDQAARFARTQPALFIGGSVAAGFALARFLRSSARHGSQPAQGGNPYQS